MTQNSHRKKTRDRLYGCNFRLDIGPEHTLEEGFMTVKMYGPPRYCNNKFQ